MGHIFKQPFYFQQCDDGQWEADVGVVGITVGAEEEHDAYGTDNEPKNGVPSEIGKNLQNCQS